MMSRMISRCSLAAMVLLLALIVVSADDISLEKECKDGLTGVTTVKQMMSLIEKLKEYKARLQSANTHDESGKLLKVAAEMERCMSESDVIIDLESIFAVAGSDICHPDHVGKLLEHKYIRLKSKSSVPIFGRDRKYLVRHFFRKYALHVSLVCRRNMINNLKTAMTKDDLTEDFRMIIPSDTDLNSSESKPFNQVMSVFGSIKTISQLAALIPIGWSESSANPGQFELNNRIMNLLNSKDFIDVDNPMVQGMLHTCDKFAKYYEGAISSVIRLDNAGYQWENTGEDESKLTQEDRQLLSNWFKVTSVCSFLSAIRSVQSGEQAIELTYYNFNNKLHETQQLGISDEFIKKNALSKAKRKASKMIDLATNIKSTALNMVICKVRKNPEITAELILLLDQLESHSGDKTLMSSSCPKWETAIGKIFKLYVIAGFVFAVFTFVYINILAFKAR